MQSLLISDNPDERALLTVVLQRVGMTVMADREVSHAVSSWSQRPADMILLALDARHETMVEGVREIRRISPVPIMLISEALNETQHAQLLEAGADRVLLRPFSSRLLIYQVQALLRRSGGVPLFSLPTLSLGGLTLDPAARMVQVHSRSAVRLTQLEFRLLYTLMVHRGQVLPTETIVEQVWGYSGEGHRDLVRGLINRLRAKIEPDRQTPRYVLTVVGVGYSFGALEPGAEGAAKKSAG
jgi:DNA-binding response OmpR family regulator